MTSSNTIHAQRWTLIHPTSVVGVFASGNAIPAYFIAHPEIGSPISGETDWDAFPGGRIQAFTGGVVGWDPDNGAREVTE